jgi:tetratricopeptide (TPR) repeat protein
MANPQQYPEAGKGKGPKDKASPTLRDLARQSQLDFEIEFYKGILEHHPDYVEVLRILGFGLTQARRYSEALEVDLRLVRLRPNDPVAHYNLACSYAQSLQTDHAIKALRRAMELGYRDFRHIRQDRDLDPIRSDPRYQQLIREYEGR